MSSGFYCYFWGVSPLSVLGYSTWLETRAPSSPLLRSLSQTEAGLFGSQLLQSEACPAYLQCGAPHPPLVSFAHIPRWTKRTEGFCREPIQGRAVDQAGSRPLSAGERPEGSPNPAPSKSSKSSKRGTCRALLCWLQRLQQLQLRGHHIKTGELSEDTCWART